MRGNASCALAWFVLGGASVEAGGNLGVHFFRDLPWFSQGRLSPILPPHYETSSRLGGKLFTFFRAMAAIIHQKGWDSGSPVPGRLSIHPAWVLLGKGPEINSLGHDHNMTPEAGKADLRLHF